MPRFEVSPPLQQEKLDKVQIGYISIASCNTLLLLWLIYLIIKISREKYGSKFQARNYKFRLFIYSLMSFTTSVRILNDVMQYVNLTKYQSFVQTPLSWLLLISPSLFLLSISSIFAYYWHEIYNSFDELSSIVRKKNKIQKTVLALFNAIHYVAALIIGIIFLIYSDAELLNIFLSIVFSSLLIATGLIVYHGINMHIKVKKILSAIDKHIKSFKTIYCIMLMMTVGCLIKIITFGLLIYGFFQAGFQLYLQVFEIDDTYFNLLLILSWLSSILGEDIVFICLICFLQSASSKSKKSFAETAFSSFAERDQNLLEPTRDLCVVIQQF